MAVPPRDLISASKLLGTWRDVTLDVGKPFGFGYWPFNPSIHRMGETWRCMVRCASYSLPNGQILGGGPGGIDSRNVLLEIDPSTWQARSMRVVDEIDNEPRVVNCKARGYEDVRLFALTPSTFRSELRAVACALQLNVRRPGVPEQVLLELDEGWRDARSEPIYVTTARALRGPWSHRAQKNWMPYDGLDHVRFLYSIDEGRVLAGGADCKLEQVAGKPISVAAHRRHVPAAGIARNEVRMMPRRADVPSAQVIQRVHKGSDNLRGGSQLIRLEADRWLGIGHEMISSPDKLYWHTFFTCNLDGRVLEKSPPFKLAENRIEFAAGLALAQDAATLVVSFGTDDHEAHLGITSRASVERALIACV